MAGTLSTVVASRCKHSPLILALQVQTPVWLAAVAVLRNFAMIKAARLYMLKEGWLGKCVKLLVGIHTRARPKELPRSEALCSFIANFSFAPDGQVRLETILGTEYILLTLVREGGLLQSHWNAIRFIG